MRPDTETEEEKTVRESIQVWYGINAGPAHCHASSAALLASIVMLLLLLNYWNLLIYLIIVYVDGIMKKVQRDRQELNKLNIYISYEVLNVLLI